MVPQPFNGLAKGDFVPSRIAGGGEQGHFFVPGNIGRDFAHGVLHGLVGACGNKQPCDGNVSLLRRGMEGCVPPFVPRIDGRPLGDEPAGGFLFPECFLCLSFACASLSASNSEGAGRISAASWVGVLSVRPAGLPISAPCAFSAASHRFPWLGRHADRQSPPAAQDRPATVRVFHATHGSPFCRQVEQPRQSMRSF